MTLDSAAPRHSLEVLDNIEVFVGKSDDIWERQLGGVWEQRTRLGRWRHENGGIIEVALGAHDSVCASLAQALVHVGGVKDVAVSKDGHAEGFLDSPNGSPICKSGLVTFHLSRATMNRHNLRTGTFEHARIGNGARKSREDAHLGCHWNA